MIRALIRKFIVNSMCHSRSGDRDMIFAAINEGMEKAFYEDNMFARMEYTVEQLTKNNKEWHPRPFLGQTTYPDVEMLAANAYNGVIMSCNYDKRPQWQTTPYPYFHERLTAATAK